MRIDAAIKLMNLEQLNNLVNNSEVKWGKWTWTDGYPLSWDKFEGTVSLDQLKTRILEAYEQATKDLNRGSFDPIEPADRNHLQRQINLGKTLKERIVSIEQELVKSDDCSIRFFKDIFSKINPELKKNSKKEFKLEFEQDQRYLLQRPSPPPKAMPKYAKHDMRDHQNNGSSGKTKQNNEQRNEKKSSFFSYTQKKPQSNSQPKSSNQNGSSNFYSKKQQQNRYEYDGFTFPNNMFEGFEFFSFVPNFDNFSSANKNGGRFYFHQQSTGGGRIPDPVQQRPKIDPYKELGVKQGASKDEIRKAYKAQALKLHPDKNQKDPKAKEKFQRLQDAYDLLK